MALTHSAPRTKKKTRAAVVGGPASALLLASVLEEARRAGLFNDEKTEHVSFRALAALIQPNVSYSLQQLVGRGLIRLERVRCDEARRWNLCEETRPEAMAPVGVARRLGGCVRRP